jgi:bisphosphoglycerate-dependent phosphoglycerate mutase
VSCHRQSLYSSPVKLLASASYSSSLTPIYRCCCTTDVPPPPIDTSSPMYPGNDNKYRHIPKAADVRTESLKVSLSYPVHSL